MWAPVFANILEDNNYVSNASLELINNFLLCQDIYVKIVTKEGFLKQMTQLFGVMGGFLDQGVREYTEKNAKDKLVEFNSCLTKFKIFMSILCILDDQTQLMMDFIKKTKLKSITSLFAMVKDTDYLKDIVSKLKFIIGNLMKKKDVINLDKTEVEYIKELAPHFDNTEIRYMIQIFGN